MSERDHPVVRSLNGGNGLPDRLALYEGFTGTDDRPAALATGLVSLAFLKASIRRKTRFWSVLAVLCLVGGLAYAVSSPPPYKASTSLLLTPGPFENVNTAASNDQAMALSRSVAELAVQRLGIQQSAASFLTTYNVTPLTERVLVITVSAPTSAEAVVRAGAVAAAFLQFRASEMQSQQQLVLASLNQQIAQAQQKYNSLDQQVTQLSAQQTGSAGDSPQLKSLKAQRTRASSTLYNLQQAAIGNQTVTQPATSAAVKGSVVLDPATPLAHSRFKPLVLDGGIGLVMGLTIGMAIVMIQALVSDKLRRRDDIAQALGTQVKVSVGPVRLRRWPGGVRGGLRGGGERALTGSPEILRIATHLRGLLPAAGDGVSSLAVVPADDPRVPALALVSVATSSVAAGKRVVLADLCRGAPAAKLLGAEGTGIQPVNTSGGRLTVAVPLGDEVLPTGPLRRKPVQAPPSEYAKELKAACDSADLLLTLVTLDPSLGSEHVLSWAGDAVVMITAGKSSWTRIRGVSEMIRLSGARLASAVLVGTDKTDESLGLVPALEAV